MITCPSCDAKYEDAQTRYCGRCGSDMTLPLTAPSAPPTFVGAPAPKPGAAPDPMIGQVVENRYRIVEKLGQGGMGAVYKVEHLRMSKLAAMKVLHPVLNLVPEIVSRFQREAETVSRLSHPNTVQVFDFGQTKSFMFLVMELIKGEDLGSVLRREGPMPFDRARLILMQVCEALTEAHEAGIVHRDLKPENLLLQRTRGGRDFIKVLDFGLAKLRDAEEVNAVTARGSLVGTPFYMSPEQIRADDLDARADIYSLGALLYRITTGEHPFSASTPVAVLTMHLTSELVPPTKRRPDLKLPPIVDEIVGRAMAKNREARYPTVEALRLALEEAPHVSMPHLAADQLEARRRGDPTGPHPSPSPTGDDKLRREDLDAYEHSLKRRRWVGLALLPLLAIGGVGGFALLKQKVEPPGVDEEVEPNDASSQANPVSSGATVRGHIGKALSSSGQEPHADRDFYRLRVGRGVHVVHLDLTGVPGMNLLLELFDAEGNSVARTDEGAEGDGEVMPNVRVPGPGDFFVMVTQAPAGRPPTENLNDWYTLTAAWQPLSATQESEPDDAPAQALPLPLEQPMRGFAGRLADVDYYYPRGEGGGTLSGKLSGIDGVDLRLVVLPPGAQSGPPGPLPPGARVFDAGGPGAPESFDGVSWPQGQSGPIVVVERKEPPSRPGKRPPPLVGLDEPYSLSVRLGR